MTLVYKEAENILKSQDKFYISLGLERVKKILSVFGNPQNKIKVIHIAGTNGKGSVCAVLSNILKCAGYKTGLYTSPHLIDYTERIRINNVKIPYEAFCYYMSRVCGVADKEGISLTEFEILTVCAYTYFCDNNVDFAVMETGLGGRLDATNTVSEKLLSIITSVSLDHTERLGNTIDKIASEKAGIITENSNVIVSEDNLGYETIKKYAEKQKSVIYKKEIKSDIIYEKGINYILFNDKKYEFPLLGLYQKKNIPLVLNAVEFLKDNGFFIGEKAIQEGFKTVIWHARLEYIKDKNILIDGAHNPDAAMELKKSLDYYFKDKKRIFIYSSLTTKDFNKISDILFTNEDIIYFYEFNHKNALSYNDFVKTNRGKNIKNCRREDIAKLINCPDLKIITGSLYMIGDICKEFSLIEK